MAVRRIHPVRAVLCVPIVTTVLLTMLSGSSRAAAPEPSGSIDRTSAAAVRKAYRERLLAPIRAGVTSSESIGSCTAGTTSKATRANTLTAINFFRGMGHLDPVTLSASLNAKAQRAALMMSANNALSHDPPSTWACYSSTGDDAAGHSNISLGLTGAAAIAGYMSDPGSSNRAVGHRRWVMYPPTATMGSGSTANANALYVFGAKPNPSPAKHAWVSWPTSGYFPKELEPGGRWSLSSTAGADFSRAEVVVRKPSGARATVRVYAPANGYGDNTLVWAVSGLVLPKGSAVSTYSVKVSGIALGGRSRSVAYKVRLIDA